MKTYLRELFDKWIEWIATVFFLASVVLTSLNDYPLYLYVSLLTNVLWLLVGIVWRKWSLIIVEAIVCVTYMIGIIKYLYGI